jgi:hypothetical protein
VNCGPGGNDTVTADRFDIVRRCEHFTAPPPTRR